MEKNNREYTIVVVRHGYSLGNQLKTLSGQSNVPLMEKGRKELVGFREKYDYPKTDLNYSSDLHRCVNTFETLYEGKSSLDGVFPQLREIHFGSYENRVYTNGLFDSFFSNWVKGEKVNDAETFDHLKNRMVEFLKKTLMDLQDRDLKSATLVSHSCAIRCLLIGLKAFKQEDFPNISITNGQGYKMTILFDGESIELKDIIAINQLKK